MAPPSQQSSSGGGGSFFQKKVGPLPMWGWIAVAVVGIYLYRRYSSGTASTAATTAAATTTPTESLTTAGGTYSGPVGYAPPGVASGGGQPNSPAAYTPPTGEAQSGAGYGTPAGASEVTGADNQVYQQVTSSAAFSSGLSSGLTGYTQPVPGTFTPITGTPAGWASVANTPVFFRQGQQPAAA